MELRKWKYLLVDIFDAESESIFVNSENFNQFHPFLAKNGEVFKIFKNRAQNMERPTSR